MDTIERELARLLGGFAQLRLALLLGSQATGEAGPDSDIDLGLLADGPISASLKLELMETIGLQLGRPVDIVDLYDAAEPVLGQALKGVRLLGDSSTYARLLTRHLVNAADFVPLQQRILDDRRAVWIG